MARLTHEQIEQANVLMLKVQHLSFSQQNTSHLLFPEAVLVSQEARKKCAFQELMDLIGKDPTSDDVVRDAFRQLLFN
jgi:hypothetical protein